jgi:hypothetical protein
MEEVDWTDSQCKAWCEWFCWDGKTYPSKPEFFSKSQLRKVVETLGEGSIVKVSAECWNYTEGLLELLKEDSDIILPKNLRDSLEKLHQYSDNSEASFLNWYNLLADIRSGTRVFLRILEKREEK